MSRMSVARRAPVSSLVRLVWFLLPIALTACIEGAQFQAGAETAAGDTDVAQLRDGSGALDGAGRDVGGDAGRDGLSDAGRDARDASDAAGDARLPLDSAAADGGWDAASETRADADGVADAGGVPFPCRSDAECAAALGAAPGPCLVAACHPQARHCFWRALPNGSVVALDDPCVLAAQCVLGAPTATVARDCDDGDACTDDRCEPGVGCAYEPLTGAPCDDANACSSEGQCLAGTCVSATNTCPCTADSDCAPFDDADRCNGRLTCDTGICVVAPDSVVRCAPPDGAGCTRLVCRPATGACEPAPKPDGSPCLDSDRCTSADACEAGVCQPGPALDCDDGNPCSTEACDPATGCAWTARGDGACDDDDPCTGGDRCVEGLCQGDRLAACACEGDEACAAHDDADRCNGVLRCADGFCALDRRAVVVCAAAPEECGALDCTCARTLCDPLTGACDFEPLPDGLPCGDDDACTLTERCAEGTCEASLWLPCDDAAPCTADRCDPLRGCVNEPAVAACDDGVPCTAGDHCEAGACTGEPYACEDGKPCTEDRCLGDGTCSPPILRESFCDIEGVGCVAADDADPADPCQVCDPLAAPRAWSAAEDGAACDDGDACTENDACEEGVCAGTPRECDDGDACTTDGCDPATGCTHDAVDCDDNLDCTADACAPATGCTHTPDDGACDDGESCTVDRCDAALGCVNDGAPRDGGSCDDGDACTTGATCLAGQCQGGSPLPVDAVDDGNECTADGCAPATGPTHAPRLDAPCTTSDTQCPVPGTCQNVGGETVCVGVPVDCGDDDPCTDDVCDPDTPGACLHPWNTADCEDDDPCTVGDVCAEGQCTPGLGTLDCDDAVGCTDDVCEPGFGCDHAPDDLACEDGDPCTVDTCSPTADCEQEDEADGVACGADLECRSGACEWAGTCAGVECPPLPGYTVACNPQAHCEYTNEDPTGWRQWDAWIYVPPGSFPMGRPDEEEGGADEIPRHEVTFAVGFFVAKYNIVVSVHETCETDGECTTPSTADYDGDGWGLNRSANGRSAHPQNGLTWAQADDACRWLGGRLPSDAEWEYSAKGPVHRKYPWGDTPHPTCEDETAVFNEAGGVLGNGCGSGGTHAAGSKPAGASWCGAMDMAGGLWEWVQDWYHTDYVGAPTDGSAWLSPAGAGRVRRGGSFNDDAPDLRSASRDVHGPLARDADYGARCVRDLSPIGVYCNTACPALPGYTATCNPQDHCEYVRSEPSEPWHEWDVWIWVPPGSFPMGRPESESGDPDELPQHAVTFAEGFFVAKHEIVVTAYEACEAASACTEPSTADWDETGWGTNRSTNGRGTHPQNGLTWQQARDFCAWQGGRLPSEARWEYAAKGPLHRKYPWGDSPEPTCTNDTATFNDWPDGVSNPGCGVGGTQPVGSRSAGTARSGALDMAGNLWEWVEDWSQPTYDGAPADGAAWVDPGGGPPVQRGGGFTSDASLLRSASRGSNALPTTRDARNGARCARDLPCAPGETPTASGCRIPGADCPGHADGVFCEDGDPCTAGDTCQAGVCTAGPPNACEDGDACTVDSCDSATGCQHATAEDGTDCGADHECVAGECAWLGTCGGTPCPALPGYAAACNAVSQCEYTNEDSTDWREWDVWIYVPPGRFDMGAPEGEPASTADERPVHPVTLLDGFLIAKHELVVAQYEACETAGACTVPSAADWDPGSWGLNRSGNGRADHPQNGVDQAQAGAACAWLGPGGRLPTEAEWEYAASGPTHRTYPWGDAPAPTCDNGTAVFSDVGDPTTGCGVNGTWPAGSMPAGASAFGVLDIAGSLHEWTADCWHDTYTGAPADGSAWTTGCTQAHAPLRGGSFLADATALRSADRPHSAPTAHQVNIGARCVRPVSPVGVYCNTACPALPGYDATCNAQNHCEYARADQIEAWHEWDVWIWVPPGRFTMGTDLEDGRGSDEGPARAVTFDEGFFLAKYETTVAQYEACEAAVPGACTPPSTADWDGDGWGTNRSSSDALLDRSRHPQNGLTWEQAGGVCRWRGGRLPSEAEWEYAATGPTHRRYPWGQSPEPTCANDTAVYNEAGETGGYGCGGGGTKPVGSKLAGAAWCGALDMAGNLFEWMEDRYHSDYAGAPTDGGAWVTPTASDRVFRGGAFFSRANGMRSAARNHDTPTDRDAYNGARCVRPLPVRSCGGVFCPELPGYVATCNRQQHCELVHAELTEPWQRWDVWIYVPPGSFEMGGPAEEGGPDTERPVHPVTLVEGFLVGKYEVTVAQYEACEGQSPGTCSAPSTTEYDADGWGTNRSSNGRADHPQNRLTWDQAGAVCRWLGGRLPSSAEWECAATGPVHRKYPWGDVPEPACDLAHFDPDGVSGRPWGCDPCTVSGCSGTRPVDAALGGSSWCGARDMAGNLWEWVEDWVHADYVGAPSDGSAWLSPAASDRVRRGGSFNTDAARLRTAWLGNDPPGEGDANSGVRCARTVPELCNGIDDDGDGLVDAADDDAAFGAEGGDLAGDGRDDDCDGIIDEDDDLDHDGVCVAEGCARQEPDTCPTVWNPDNDPAACAPLGEGWTRERAVTLTVPDAATGTAAARRTAEPLEIPLANGILDDSVLGYWPLDGGTAADASGNGNDGEVQGTPDVTDGPFEGAHALHFDGTYDQVRLERTEAVEPTGASSVSAWVWTDRGTAHMVYSGWWGSNWRGLNLGVRYGCSMSIPEGRAVFTVGDDTPRCSAAIGRTTVSDGRWHHVVGVFRPGSPSMVELWVDGRLDAKQTTPVSALGWGASRCPGPTIGVECEWPTTGGGDNTYRFGGSLADVVLFGRALAPEEIAGYYQSRRPYGSAFVPGAQSDLDDVRVAETTPSGGPHTVPAEVLGPRPHSDSPCPAGADSATWLDRDDLCGVVAYWRLDGGAAAATGAGVAGDVQGASAASGRFGDADGSLHFGGPVTTDRVVIPAGTPVPLAGDFTVETWFLLDEAPNPVEYGSSYPFLLDLRTWTPGPGVGPLMAVRYEAGRYILKWHMDCGSYSQKEAEIPLVPKRWHHAAGVRRDGVLHIYFDGRLLDVGYNYYSACSETAVWQVLGGPMTLGTNFDASATSNLKGKLDEVLIHSVAKSPEYLSRRANPGVPTVRFLAHTTPTPDRAGRFPFLDYRLHWGNAAADAAPAIPTGRDGTTRCFGLLSPCLGYAGWWRFNEGAGTVAVDASTGKRAGTLHGATSLPAWVAGAEGTALSFDGSEDSVDVRDVPVVPDGSPFSLEAVVAPAGCPHAGDKARIAEREGADGGYSLALSCGDGTAAAAVESNGWSWVQGPVLAAGQLAALAAVSEATTLTLFADGVPSAPMALVDADTTSAADFRIGANAGPGVLHFWGVIDSVRLMSRALTPDELLQYPSAQWSFGPVLDGEGQPVE